MKTDLLIYAPYYLDPRRLTSTTTEVKFDKSKWSGSFYFHPNRPISAISATSDRYADLERNALQTIRPIKLPQYKTRGPKPLYHSAAQFAKEAIQAHLRLVKESRAKFWEFQHVYSQESIAYEMGYKSVKGWRKRARALLVDLAQLKDDALLAERNLPKTN